ncbi:uncharacterized protein LOC120839869 [Ixodes scapularis]|uniref:uncharacterized protein LOC120839869 n=1 Tax=Ixodes scapularis TaxID=6945 RepID=UPI001A9CE687|nr:uncharacterized protein LOC120839869 [Ixodes scapularis]
MANVVTQSRNLFTRYEGGPMCFSLIPCAERKEIREMIEYGGGMLVQPGVNPRAISLVPAGATVSVGGPDLLFSTEFVRECSKRGQLVPLKNFVVEARSSSPEDGVEDIDDEGETAHRIRGLRSIRVRENFSFGEDISIAKFMAAEPGPIRGNEVYKRLERSGLAGKHTWQALKERYQKKIYSVMHLFECPVITGPQRLRAKAAGGTVARPHDENRACPPPEPWDVPGTSGSAVPTPPAAADADEQSSPATSTCSSHVVSETDYLSAESPRPFARYLCDESPCLRESSDEFDQKQPFVPSFSGSVDDVSRGKPPESQEAAHDHSIEIFVSRFEESVSTMSPDTSGFDLFGDSEPFDVTSFEGQAASKSDSLGVPEETSFETTLNETPTDGFSEHSSMFAPLATAPMVSSSQALHLHREGGGPLLSELCSSPGDLELLLGKLSERASHDMPESQGDPHLASFPDFPSGTQGRRPTPEPAAKLLDAQVFAGEDSSSAKDIWARSRDVGRRTGRRESPRRAVRRSVSPPGVVIEGSPVECEQPGPSGASVPDGGAVFSGEDGDLHSSDNVIVRKGKTGKWSRAVLDVSSSRYDVDGAAASRRQQPLDEEVLEQHQRNLQLMLDAKKKTELEWRKQRPHRRCPPNCSCPQSAHHAQLLRLLTRTRAILAFHDSLDADPEACALLSELIERRRANIPAPISTRLERGPTSSRRSKK